MDKFMIGIDYNPFETSWSRPLKIEIPFESVPLANGVCLLTKYLSEVEGDEHPPHSLPVFSTQSSSINGQKEWRIQNPWMYGASGIPIFAITRLRKHFRGATKQFDYWSRLQFTILFFAHNPFRCVINFCNACKIECRTSGAIGPRVIKIFQ